MITQREALRSHILEKERKTLRTSNDITDCQEKLLSVTKSLKSNIHEHRRKQTTSSTQLTNSNSTKSKVCQFQESYTDVDECDGMVGVRRRWKLPCFVRTFHFEFASF